MKIRKIIISALSVLMFSVVTTIANAGCGKLVIAEQNWASAELMANVDKIILENGSVENISEVPNELKEIYKTVWEVSQKTVIDMAADRAPFIDQTQSMNLWLSTPTFGKVNSMHMYAWKKGLKTGMYYLRSRSAVDAVKVTVSSEKAAKDAYIETSIKQNNEPEDCETCSA